MPFKLFIALLIFTAFCYSQTNIADILYPLTADTTDYSDLPVYKYDELKDMQYNIEIPTLPYNMCQFSKCDFLDSAKSKQFRKIDINGDGEMDIIYSTNQCADEILNLIWIKQKSYYKFSEYRFGTIMRVFKNKDNSHSLLIRSGYCCGGLVGSYKLFNLPGHGHYKTFENQFNTICEFRGTQFPNEKIQSKSFYTILDKARLRTSHEEINSLDSSRSEFEAIAVYGNIIAEYVEKSTGKIFSEYIDTKNEHWYFVLMDATDLICYNRFYNANFSFKCGWINSKDVKIL